MGLLGCRFSTGLRSLGVRGVSASLIFSICGCAPADDPAATWFSDEASARGIAFKHVSGKSPDGRLLFPDIMGSGAALADLDGDGDLDAYLVQGGHLIEQSGLANEVYLNRGDGHFTKSIDPGDARDTGYGMGVAAGDYDNDGDIDLYVTNVGENVLLANDGTGGFRNVSRAAGVAHDGFGTAATFADFDADNDLDLFLVNYIDWDLSIERDCFAGGVRTYCPPTNYAAPAMDVLYRNNGDGTFTDVTEVAGINLAYGKHASNFRPGKPGLGVVTADYDGNGLLDVFVANDLMADQLWLNQGGLEFKDAATLWGCDLDEHGIAKAGMGVATGDIDEDGDFDLLVVNNIGQTDSFFRNERGWFTDVTSSIGLGTSSRRFTRFGVALADFDNDGRLDLYHANGAISAAAETAMDSYAQPNVLYRGGADGFREVQPQGGVATRLVHTSRGLAIGDVNDDGGIDLLVANRDAAPYLLINQRADRGNWIRFRALDQSGRDAYGAVVSLQVGDRWLTRQVQPDGSYLAANDPRVHFGLGSASKAGAVTVRWPTGEKETFDATSINATLSLRQGEGAPG
jgi:hypothetical protein